MIKIDFGSISITSMILLVGRAIYASRAARSISSPSFTSSPHSPHFCICFDKFFSINKHLPTRLLPDDLLNLT